MNWDTLSVLLAVVGLLVGVASILLAIVGICVTVVALREGRAGVRRIMDRIGSMENRQGPSLLVGAVQVAWPIAFPGVPQLAEHTPAEVQPEESKPPASPSGRPWRPWRPVPRPPVERPDDVHPARPNFGSGYQTTVRPRPEHTGPDPTPN